MGETTGGAGRTGAARPLSPHLMSWRPHLTMIVSISHRITGSAMYVGVLIIAGWAAALASGPDAFDQYRALLGSPLGKLVQIGLTFCIFFHLANGLRYLGWDLGKGFCGEAAPRTPRPSGGRGLRGHRDDRPASG